MGPPGREQLKMSGDPARVLEPDTLRRCPRLAALCSWAAGKWAGGSDRIRVLRTGVGTEQEAGVADLEVVEICAGAGRQGIGASAGPGKTPRKHVRNYARTSTSGSVMCKFMRRPVGGIGGSRA